MKKTNINGTTHFLEDDEFTTNQISIVRDAWQANLIPELIEMLRKANDLQKDHGILGSLQSKRNYLVQSQRELYHDFQKKIDLNFRSQKKKLTKQSFKPLTNNRIL